MYRSDIFIVASSKLIPITAPTDDNDDEWLVSDGDDFLHEAEEIMNPSPSHAHRDLNSFITPTLLSKWKAIRTRDDRVSAAILLPSGLYEREGGIKMEIEGDRTLKVNLASWSPKPWYLSIRSVYRFRNSDVSKISATGNIEVKPFRTFCKFLVVNNTDVLDVLSIAGKSHSE